MKKTENEALFELVRKAPTELSQEKVMQIIGTLPTLPPPPGNSWFNNINLNSIIMTTTTVAIIASAVIYFSSPNTESPDPGQDLVPPVQVESTEPTSPVLAADDSIVAIKDIPEPAAISVENNDSIETMALETTEAVPNTPVAKTADPIEVVPVPDDSLRPTENTKPPALVLPVAEADEASAPVATRSRATADVQPIVEAPKPTKTKPAREAKKLDDLRLKRLKRTLLRELSRDLLIKSKRALNVVHFKQGEIFVNNQRLSYEEFTKYSELLFKFRVEPGPEKRVVTDPKFVMVGSFTERGFDGSMQGRAMDLHFVNDGVILNGLLDKSGNRKPGSQGVVLFDEPKTTVQPGDILMSAEGSAKDGQLNFSGLDRYLTDSLGLPGLGDREFEVVNFKNAATISTLFDSEAEDNTIKMSNVQVRNFKKELYKMLVNDDQIASKNKPVIMLISPSPFKVNDNNVMSGQIWQKYIRLLAKYDLVPAVNRKILMNSDFIMIGDFNNGEFSGTAQGTIEKERVKGTVLEEELSRSKIFGGNEDRPLTSEERTVAPFQKLEVSGLAVVYLRQAAYKAIQVDATGIALSDIITESENGVLKISTSQKEVNGESISIYVTSPEVNSIQTDGAAEVFSQGMFKADILKLISKGSGAIEMAVDVNRLHLQMDGGDIHLEGRAEMEKVDFLPESDRGTLDQSGLNVIERWTHEGGSTWSEQDLPQLRYELLSKLIDQGYISTLENPASIKFYNGKMTVNGTQIAPNYIDDYRALYRTYGLPTHANSRLWIDPDFMVIAEKDGEVFELEVMGTELELNIEGSWEELEEAILHRQ